MMHCILCSKGIVIFDDYGRFSRCAVSLVCCSLFPLAAGVQANEQYGEQFVIMFSLIMTQLKMVQSMQCNTLNGFTVLLVHFLNINKLPNERGVKGHHFHSCVL